MTLKLNHNFDFSAAIKTTMLLMGVVFFLSVLAPTQIAAQKKFVKKYPATKNVRLELANRTGTIIVEGWDRNEVEITAYMEAPVAAIEPKNLSGTIRINVIQDNQGKDDIGNVNFTIRVPFSSSVDIQTVIGNLSVNNIQGGLVRAHISSEGDITLTNIGAGAVSAENVMGDIFFDGLMVAGGTYRFTSINGNINLRIPFDSSFRLVATAPSSRNIALGEFANPNMSFVSEGRRVIGRMGDGSASLTVTNQRGSIGFIRR